jgi:hypothetical protein
VSRDYRDLVITELADENAELIDLIADLAWENYWLRVVAERAFRKPYQKRDVRTDDVKGRAA